jgi:DMSO reductase family type II enzyme heme b subunit
MRGSTKAVLTFSVTLLLLGVGYFLVVYSVTRDQLVGVTKPEPLVVGYTSSTLPIDPFAEFWTTIEPMQIHLWPQNARLPYGREERDILVRGAFNDVDVSLLVEFEDETENRDTSSTPDACAVFLGPEDSPPAAQMMGQDATGNLWHWLADRDTEQYVNGVDSLHAVLELITVGPGTQTPLPDQTVMGKGDYRDGKWRVVFKRSLSNQQEGGLELSLGSTSLISFAVWDGAQMEAFAMKSISIVQPLVLVPTQQRAGKARDYRDTERRRGDS